MSNARKNKNKKIYDKAFIPLTSIKQSILLYEIMNKEHEFFYFTKKGKVKELDISKKLYILMEVPSKYKIFDGTKELKKSSIKLCSKNTNSINNIYIINFKDFCSSIKSYMFDNENYNGIKAVCTETGEIVCPWIVCKSVGSVCDKNEKELIQMRFDL